MPKHRCPFPDCTYETEDITGQLAAVMLTVHNNGVHTNKLTPAPAHKVEKVKRPTISAESPAKRGHTSRHNGKNTPKPQKIDGKEKVIQLLESCNENLRKDLTRNARRLTCKQISQRSYGRY